ncbi:hypothetical protein LZZ90_10365 [Flavobacterium sp. SM15]|uniref:hypothetical protein n=1 Tax=Flavobacterium sp. SM15 TaxID=2908005 RepID=UPI001EDBEB63|nr:hypothetical protein [Flavobacterium sp. SM15]MCG2611909.1 hypothetical protein [Flavobacterium sp. SM15]
MKKTFLTTLLLAATLTTFSQEIKYKSGGRIFNSEGKKMSPNEVRELLAKEPGMLQFYNAGRSKKTAGNTLMIAGLGLMATDVLIGANKDTQFPSALSYIGAASFLISIPVKIGFSKKIKTVVKDYNAKLSSKDSGNTDSQLYFVSNGNNTFGVKIIF